ncbi:MAG: hypothetical protein QF546_02010 [Alphaproteobacteria bacterium]|jgi:hypothetical protein|nr:hypothetical protein [Alphaproteobacteria bacterium]HJP20565.1 hypothetical protein [Alphaproteobacteria bacterium]
MASYTLRLLEDQFERGASARAMAPGNRMTYCRTGGVSVDGNDLAPNQVAFSAAPCDLVATADDTHLLRFELVARGEEDGLLRGDGVASTLKMAEEVELSGTDGYFMRCDRIDFPPGGIAWHHTHVGPGIRCLLKGELQVETAGLTHELRPFDPWFEAGPDIVLATASKEIESAFVRGMVLPRDILGQSSVRYRDPEQKDKPVPLGRTNFRDELIAI